MSVHALLSAERQAALGRPCQAVDSHILPLMPPALEFLQKAQILTGPSFPPVIVLQNGGGNVTFPDAPERVVV